MNVLVIGIIQSVPIVITLVVLGVRLEHRLTKIETDVSWIKRLTGTNCKPCNEKEKE